MKAYKPTQKTKPAAKSVGKACVPERKKPFKKPVKSGAQEEDLSVYTQKEERQTRVRRKTEEKAAPAPVYTATFKANHSDLLLDFLLRKCKTSRNNVKTLLARGLVLVNGSVVKQFDFPLAKDDEVKISKNPVLGARVAAKKAAAKPKKAQSVKILLETDEFLAIDKPCGLLSVENEKERESAFDYAFSYLQEQGKNVRPYVLHRIDKETSGVLVFAKNPKIHSKLRLKWNESVTLREYFAVVDGVPPEKEGTITSFLKENKNGLVYSTSDPTGQKAVTHYTVEKSNGEHSLLKVKIETGRKNQIRVHMQKLGCPVVGDDKYGGKSDPFLRLGLHAHALEFIHPESGEVVRVVAACPPIFHSLF